MQIKEVSSTTTVLNVKHWNPPSPPQSSMWCIYNSDADSLMYNSEYFSWQLHNCIIAENPLSFLRFSDFTNVCSNSNKCNKCKLLWKAPSDLNVMHVLCKVFWFSFLCNSIYFSITICCYFKWSPLDLSAMRVKCTDSLAYYTVQFQVLLNDEQCVAFMLF